MKKRIIKTIIALALTVALCPTVPTLAAETDWKDIYTDFIKVNIKNYKAGQEWNEIVLADLNLDGTPELIILPGYVTQAGVPVKIYQIISNKVQLVSEDAEWFEPSENSVWCYPLSWTNSGRNQWWKDIYGNNIDYTFSLKKNQYTNELMYICFNSGGEYLRGIQTLSCFADLVTFDINRKFFISYWIDEENENDIKSAECYIDSNSVSKEEYDTTYNEFIGTWQDTGYQIAYRDINDNKMTDQEIKDFLNSYIPERKALGLDISVTVNGNEIDFDQPPVIVDERTLVPLRAIFEALGATVDWNGNTQTVTSTLNDTTVTLAIGSNTMYKNGEVITLDVPAQLIGDRTLVPVRAIAEAYGATVDWEQATYTVKIQK